MKYYSDDLIEEIRIRNDIVDVISEYVKLDKKGTNNFGLCPFHKEKTPSFCVSETKQIFNCFGCGKGGNVIQFIMLSENLDFIDAIKYLADRAKIDLPEADDKEGMQKSRLRKELLKINTEAARFFHVNLMSDKHLNIRKYFENRGLGENNLKKFGLGYSTDEWDGLYKFLVEKGFNIADIEKSGLVLKNKNGGFYDRFRSRIMFPIFDVRGNVIAFGGRVTDDSMPKYMNSPETAVYYKGKNLYALNLAKNAGETKIIVVEGYMDVISLHKHGISNSVASLGTALTESQGRLLKKYSEEIIISYDADTAGEAATLRGLDILNQIGCNVKVLVIPDGKDPDEYVRKHGPDEFKKLANNSVSLLEYKVKILKSKMKTETTDEKIKFLNKVADLLAKIENGMERETYIRSLARQYFISEDSINSEINKRLEKQKGIKRTVVEKQEIKTINNQNDLDAQTREIVHDEKMLMSLICIDNNIYFKLKDKIIIEDFIDENDKLIAKMIFERIENKKGIIPAELLGLLEPVTAGEFATIIQKECNCEDNLKAVLDIIKKIKIYSIDKQTNAILKKLNDKENITENDTENLKIELNSLIIKRKNIS